MRATRDLYASRGGGVDQKKVKRKLHLLALWRVTVREPAGYAPARS